MIPQIILIHLLNHLFFADSIKSNIPHRIFVMIEMTPMIAITNMIVAKNPSHVVGRLVYAIIITMIDPMMDKSCMIPVIRLIIFANHVCFLASLKSKKDPRIAPIIKMILITCIPIGKSTEVVVVAI